MMVEHECPSCGGMCHRDSADIGVGVVYGPWGCPECGWSEYEEYDQRSGQTYQDGYGTDQYGRLYPTVREPE